MTMAAPRGSSIARAISRPSTFLNPKHSSRLNGSPLACPAWSCAMADFPLALEIRGLNKSFDRPVVKDLELSVKGGEFYALLGPNGAGKTTILRTVAGLLQPESGSISVF